MTTDRAVMQQALDAMDQASRVIGRYDSPGTTNWIVRDMQPAIAALRQALAQPVPDVAAVPKQIIELIQAYGDGRADDDGAASNGALVDLIYEIRAAMGTQPAPAVQAPAKEGWPKLEKPASLLEHGGATFGKGVSSRLLVEAAYRHHERTQADRARTPEQRKADEMNRRAGWDLFNGNEAPAVVDASRRHHTQCTRYNNNCGAVHPSNCPECPFRKGAQP